MDVFRSFANSSNKGPVSLNSRYVTEDVPMGLALFSSIGKVINVDTSISDSLITIASSLMGTDYFRVGRTIQYLTGKDVLDLSYINHIITEL